MSLLRGLADGVLMSDLTAIDILMLPGREMLTRAAELNERMRTSIPGGFALDEQHTPHITLLQLYARSAELDRVFDAVKDVFEGADPRRLELRGVKVEHMEGDAHPGAGLAGLVVDPGPAVIDLQHRLIDATRPYASSGGTGAAFVTSAAEPVINDETLAYVERYVPDHSGRNFLAHVTVGLAKLDFLADLEACPFDVFEFQPAGFAIFQLGNNGTAQRELIRWDVTPAGS